jgi:hypothetical protein
MLGTDAWLLTGLTTGQRTQDHNKRFGSVLKKLGWEHAKVSIDGKLQNGYARKGKREDARGKLGRVVVERATTFPYEVTVWSGEEGRPKGEAFESAPPPPKADAKRGGKKKPR